MLGDDYEDGLIEKKKEKERLKTAKEYREDYYRNHRKQVKIDKAVEAEMMIAKKAYDRMTAEERLNFLKK